MKTTLLLFIIMLSSCKQEEKIDFGHFDPKGKPPSKFTIEKQNLLRITLPMKDRKDFEEQKKGFIAAPEYKKIMADAGHVAWDMEKYEFLLQDKDFDSIHPSLQRQAILNMNYGLYEVVPGVYQVRGFDLANISFVKGKKGWIVFDPLSANETAKAAYELVTKHLGKRPITAVIFSHSHADHFMGVKGVVDEKDVKSGKVKIIAPEGFMEYAISENIYAGNAMSRRLFYQYGVLIPAGPFGHVDQSIGKNVAAGTTSLIEPNIIIKKDIETIVVDGIKLIFQNTPGTEAPAEMNTYIPKYKAFWGAENITGTIHNIYTLRGALVRDALKWSKYINNALYTFGNEAKVMFASHSWPRWGKDRIQEVLRGQRDMYAHLNNQVLHLANKGVTVNEVHNVYKVPKSLQEQWYARGYHGSMEHNSRGVINRYLGYWDANPTTLIPLSPKDSAPLYVEMMGGANKIISKGQKLFNEGKYKLAQEILNKLVYAEPDNQKAKDLLADNFEQIGYQQESPSVRNSFLGAAIELRGGITEGTAAKSTGPGLMQAMTTELFLDFLGIKMDSEKAEGMNFKVNFITPDNGEKFIVEMSNATLTNIKGYTAKDADLTLTINRSDLILTMAGSISLADHIKSGKAKVKGNVEILEKLKSTMVEFDPFFELLPGTKAKEIPQKKENPFEVRASNHSGE